MIGGRGIPFFALCCPIPQNEMVTVFSVPVDINLCFQPHRRTHSFRPPSYYGMPPRKKQKTTRNAHPSEADGVASSPSAIVPSWKGAKRRRASLEKFVDGPVDIVVEVRQLERLDPARSPWLWFDAPTAFVAIQVLALVHPRDLFTLVRTSSIFKTFLV